MSDLGNPKPISLFPLIRHLSYWATKLLYKTPATPNHITAVSLAFGVAAAWMFLNPSYYSGLTGAVFFLVCYLLDNSDGEIARMKNLPSDFGQRFDTFVDWVVHAALFLAFGLFDHGTDRPRHLAMVRDSAAAGGTINYILDTLRDTSTKLFEGQERMVEDGPSDSKTDQTAYASRVIRTDFCFIVLGLALFNSTWLLVPAAAIGAQLYWMLQFAKGFRRHHV